MQGKALPGKGAISMESPQMKAAIAAQALMRGEKLAGIDEIPAAIAANDKDHNNKRDSLLVVA